MKKIILVFMIAAFAAACTSSGPVQDREPSTETKNAEPAHSHGAAEEKTSLSLNEGSKWKLDEGTRKNIRSLRMKTEDKEPADPIKRAALIRETLNTLISECRMKGKDHDALHLWLEGFQEKLGVFEKEKTTEALAALTSDLREFDKFFE